MLSAPTSANWARLNAVRIGMWRRSSSSTTPGPTMQASISPDGSARNSPATSGTSASDSDSALWRKLTWTTNTSAAANASASAHHGSRRSPAGASRWRTTSTNRIAAMEAMAAISAQTGPSERRRARTRRATLSPLRGAASPLDACTTSRRSTSRPSSGGRSSGGRAGRAGGARRRSSGGSAAPSTTRAGRKPCGWPEGRAASAAATSSAPSPVARGSPASGRAVSRRAALSWLGFQLRWRSSSSAAAPAATAAACEVPLPRWSVVADRGPARTGR